MGVHVIKKGDFVQVISGKHKGKTSLVEKVFLEDAKVVLKDINLVRRHVKPSQENPQGFVEKKVPIHISNVSLVDPVTEKPGRVGYRIENGVKTRYFKKTNASVESNQG
jgi:large subunit ribosomal protein L24